MLVNELQKCYEPGHVISSNNTHNWEQGWQGCKGCTLRVIAIVATFFQMQHAHGLLNQFAITCMYIRACARNITCYHMSFFLQHWNLSCMCLYCTGPYVYAYYVDVDQNTT